MSQSPVDRLADEFLDFRRRTDVEPALWASELIHLDGWPDLAVTGSGSLQHRFDAFGERAAQLTPTSDAGRLLAETIAFTGRAKAIQHQWMSELTWVNPPSGLLALVFAFLPRQPLATGDDGDRYLAFISSFPGFMEQWTQRLEAAADEGVVPSEHQVRSLVTQLDRWLDRPISEGPLGAQSPPRGFDEAKAEQWRRTFHSVLDDPFAASLVRVREAMVRVTLPGARSDDRPGLAHLDGGGDLYRKLVWAHTTLDVPPERVHDVGLDVVARLEDEYRSIAAPVLGTKDVSEIFAKLRGDTSLHYHDTQSLVDDASAVLDRAAGSLAGWFGRTPRARCTANAIEHGAAAYYSKPTRDGSKPGQFFFNTAQPEMWGTYQLEVVTFHEGIPGHHLQLAIAQEREDLHPLLSDYYIAAYNEGWGLYTERLADEMGLYSSELDRIGMLSADSMRACRLVVDTGIHALGWSRTQAIDYMFDNSPLSRTQVEGEIDRYIGTPGQALGYMMGRLEIERIRQDAERALGESFDIAAFHDTVLSTGSVPLATLRRHVERWSLERGR